MSDIAVIFKVVSKSVTLYNIPECDISSHSLPSTLDELQCITGIIGVIIGLSTFLQDENAKLSRSLRQVLDRARTPLAADSPSILRHGPLCPPFRHTEYLE